MQHVKMLGLVAIMAMGLMAFGVGAASATKLCTTTDTPECTMAYGVGTEIHAILKTGTSAKLWDDPKGETPLVICQESTMKSSIGNAGSATSTVSGALDTTLQENGQRTGLTWGNCGRTTDTVSAGEFEIHWISGTHNGTVTSKNTEVTTIIFGVTCTYGAKTGVDLGTLTSGENPSLAVLSTIYKTAGPFLCPEDIIWEAEYEVTSPHALYVTEK